MALPLANSFEGGTNGTAMSASNTGGASGDAFNGVTGTAPNFSNSHPAHGTLGMAVQGTGAMQWTSTSVGTPTTVWGRFYLYFTANPSAIAAIWRGLTPASSTTAQFSLRLNTTGTLNTIVKSGTVRNSATVLSTNTLYRVEWKAVVVKNGTCTLDVNLYLGDSTTLTESMTQATGTGGASDTSINQGWFGSSAAVTANTIFLDDIQMNSTGFPGPSVVSTTRNISDTGVTQTDAVATTLARELVDAGVGTAFYADAFTRSVAAGGWGTADSGQTWAALGTTTASYYSVDGSEGLVSPTANGTNIFGIDAGGSFADGDVLMDVMVDSLPTGTEAFNTGIGIRTQASSPEQNYYRARLLLAAGVGTPTVELATVVANAATVIGSANAGAGTYTAGTWWRIRFRAVGSHLQVRAWPAASAEPSTWDVDVTDSTWASGGVLQREQVSGGGTPVFSYDNLSGVAVTDSVSAHKPSGPVNISDTGVSQSDGVASTRQRTVTATGVTQSDTVRRGVAVNVTDQGVAASGPQVLASNSFEEGSNGTTITTTNTGDAADQAFDNVAGSPSFSNTEAHSGSLSAYFPTGAARHVDYLAATLGSPTSVWSRAYVWLTALPSGTVRVVSGDGPTTQNLHRVSITPAGLLSCLILGSGSTSTSSVAVATGQWVRIETLMTTDGTTATVEVRLWNSPDSTGPPDADISQSGSTSDASVAGVELGPQSTFGADQYWDDVAVSTSGWIGPTGGLFDTVSATFTPGASGFTRNVSDTGVSESDTVATSRLRGVADTGESQSDTLASTRRRPVTDRATTMSDTVATTRRRVIADTGTSFADAVATTRRRAVADTGEAQTDVLAAVRIRPVTDTGATVSDQVAATRTRRVSDTGEAQSDALTATRARGVADTGESQSDVVTKQARHGVTDAGESQSDSLAGARVRLVSDTGLVESDAVTATKARGIVDAGETQTDVVARTIRRGVTDTGDAQSDAPTTIRTRRVIDTGETQSDAVAALRPVSVTDTGEAQSDVVAIASVRVRALADTGASQSDAVTKVARHGVADTGATITDTTLVSRVRPVTDTGAVQSDAVRRALVRALADTGATVTDAPTATKGQPLTDTGESQTDVLAAASAHPRPVTDTGATQTDAVASTRARLVTDTGASQTDAVTRALRRGVADTGATQSDVVTASGTGAIRPSDTGTSFSDQVTTTRRPQVTDTGESQVDVVVSARQREPTDTGTSMSDHVTRALVAPRPVTDTGTAFSDVVTRTVTPGMGGGTAGRIIDGGVAEQYPSTITDTFSRTVASGLGTADTGEVWQGSGSWSVNGSAALITPTNNSSVPGTLQSVDAGDSEALLDVSFAAFPTGNNVGAGVMLRGVAGLGVGVFSNVGYVGRVVLQSNQALVVRIERQRIGGASTISSNVTVAAVYTPGDVYRVRFNATGRVLSLKVWKVGTTEPSSWTTTATDPWYLSGVPGIFGGANSGTTSIPQMTLDNYTVVQLTAQDAVGRVVGRGVTDQGATITDTPARVVAVTRAPTDTGVVQSDQVSTNHGGQVVVADTGSTVSDQVGRGLVRGVADTGVVQSDEPRRVLVRGVSDTFGFSDTVAGGASGQRLVTDQGVAESDALTAASAGTRLVTDAGVAQTDVVARRVALGLADVGVTLSDAPNAALSASRSVTDVGETQTDALAGVGGRVVVDTGADQSDVVGLLGVRGLADVGVSVSDDVDVTAHGKVGVTSVGATMSDVVARTALRGVTDTGESQSDATQIQQFRFIVLTDVGVRFSDFVGARHVRIPSVSSNLTETGVASRVTFTSTRSRLGQSTAGSRTDQGIVYSHLRE